MYQVAARKMFKRTSAIAAIAIALGASGFAKAEEVEPLWANVKKAGVLRCGAAVAPPYVMRDPMTGNYSGFFADLCRDFGQNVLKVKVQFVDTTWDNIVAGLQANKWDMSVALNNTPERAKAIGFSSAASNYEVSFVYNKTNPKVGKKLVSIADIDKPGAVVAVMSGTSQDKAVSAVLKQAQIMRLPGIDETRMAVSSRRADFIADASDTNWIFSESHGDWAKTFVPNPALAKQEVAFGIRKNTSPDDVAMLNAYLKKKVSSGYVNALIKKAVQETLASGK
ncbi:transporter substrate-binding domain-containing protein [Vogesella sp. LYT5W]|uniref:Transporter substrate-binding domain-containing protein n=1 Tax=Vogesella margarita TaxID=2984199 RepID=A0ABT5IM90_9NEIS|nr:transporter substrate-binding domain-containing protein [Vogesella margarita]MDC7713653.1 transporter substrate-binding domain-containing protein [Vogesella margarita]